MYINVFKFFELDYARWCVSPTGQIIYEVSIVSKSTGEVITLIFDRAHFDELLAQMEDSLEALANVKEELYDSKNWR